MDSELDFTDASIEELRNADESRGTRVQPPAPSIQLPNQDAEYVSHIAIDIGGSLIKLVYFSTDPADNGAASDGYTPSSSPEPGASNGGLLREAARTPNSTHRGGKLHFVKFETSRVDDAIDFIEAKGLHRYCGRNGTKEMRVKATGGGAFKYSDRFKERLGVVLEKEDEMACLVSGCNFLLKAIRHEAFTYEAGVTTFVPTNEDSDLYPYLLVNIGSGVSMVKVSGDNQSERVSGSSIGGGTFWGLCRLLTRRSNFDEMLDLSMQGDSSNVDMLVGDIYGGRDYSAIGLSATTIASSFGKVVSQDKNLEQYAPADMCLALCRMVAYNIGQLAHMTAVKHGIKRILFGGFFIRGHPYTMETISYAIRFWSKGEMAAMFLRHEGFLGAVGAFLTVHPMVRGGSSDAHDTQARKVRARFVERFSMGAPLTGGAVVGPPIRNVSEKVGWVEKFVAAAARSPTPPADASAASASAAATGAAAAAAGPAGGHASAPLASEEGVSRAAAYPDFSSTSDSGLVQSEPGGAAAAHEPAAPRSADGPPLPTRAAGQLHPAASLEHPLVSPGAVYGSLRQRMSLHVGVLHYSPTLEPFPLLADLSTYEPNTLDINADEEELRWWLNILRDQIPVVVEKACASEGNGEHPRRRAQAFGRAFGAHLDKLQSEPGSYGVLGLSELFEMREECLREFGFTDVYRLEKAHENSAALAVLPDLLRELDAEPLPGRLLRLVEGVLAANIFDWGSQACVALYRAGTILDIYRSARERLAKRPWARDDFDAFAARVVSAYGTQPDPGDMLVPPPSPPYRRVMMFVDNSGADVVLGMLPLARELLRLGCEVVVVANALPAINDITAPELRALIVEAAEACPIIKAAREAAIRVETATGGHVPPYPGLRPVRRSSNNLLAYHHQHRRSLASARRGPGTVSPGGTQEAAGTSGSSSASSTDTGSRPDPAIDAPVAGPAAAGGPAAQGGAQASPGADVTPAWHAAASNPAINKKCPKLYVVSNGQGSPCLDLRRVPDRLAEACVGVDLLIIEGMGRAIHTNYKARFRCDVLKLAMIKTERLARKLFNGTLYDCVCQFDAVPR